MLQKKRKTKLLIIFSLFIFIIASGYISYKEFSCINFISVGIGLGRIMFFNTEYVEIQKNPQIVIAKRNGARDNLIKYMNNRGFILKEQMGSMIFFEDNMSIKQSVLFYSNKYYSKWIWK